MDSAAWRGFPFDWYPPAPVVVFAFPPMLAALKHSLPIGDQWLYEPKLDGFRGLLRHGTNGHVQVLSRNLRDLAPSFPELGQAACSLPAGTLLDGEIVIADESGHAGLCSPATTPDGRKTRYWASSAAATGGPSRLRCA